MTFAGKTYSIGDTILIPAFFGGFHEMVVTENGATNETLNAIFLDGEVLAIVAKNIFKEL